MATSHRLTLLLAGTFAVSLCTLNQVQGQVLYSSVGSLYNQNFDSLPNSPENVSLGASPIGWIDDTTTPGANQFSILGWYLFHPTVQSEGGANGNQRMRIGAGTANTGAFMSYGASANTDRALGDLGSNTLAPAGGEIYFGLRLRNNTGVALGSFTLTYNGEQWRDGGAATPVAQGITFSHSTSATTISDSAGHLSVPGLGFSSPVFVNITTGAAVDGNVAGRVNGISATVTVDWQPGTDLWLRWSDVNHAGNDHGLAIDDLVFTAQVPEPSSAALLVLGGLSLLLARRKKN